MKSEDKDILQSVPELKQMPYSIPEGYFMDLGAEIMERTVHRERKGIGILHRLAPYMTVAAMFAIIVTTGTFFMRMTSEDAEFTFEDYIMMTESLTGFIWYEDSEWRTEEAGIGTEDIADYLIYTGAGTENFYLLYE